MNHKKTFISSFVLFLLLAQVNLPLFIHICDVRQTVTFLASCGMHDAIPEKKSCCKDESKTHEKNIVTNTETNSHCEIIFAKENSADARVHSSFTDQTEYLLISEFLPVTNSPALSSDIKFFSSTDASPHESPPLFLLDSNFRI